MTNDLDELKLLLGHTLDVTELLDLLDISMPELIDILEEQIEEKYEECVRACR